jgi:(R,R)-butanediol dehydrogenase / meso-butanediol dehydrogenase / diacetyl reductase
MRTLRLHGPRDARIENVQRPDLRPGTVRIDVAFGGICGSDLALYQDAPVPQDYANPIMGETGLIASAMSSLATSSRLQPMSTRTR